MKELLVVALVAMVVAPALGGGTLSQPEIKVESLKKHNDLRRGEGSSNMIKLEWDDKLAQAAQRYADGCYYKHYEHEFGKDPGENLAYVSLNNDEEIADLAHHKDKMIEMMQSWWDEKNDYPYGTKSGCGSYGACHYTQMAWSKTAQIGCGMSVCKNLQLTDRRWTKLYLVCRYWPGGNLIGVDPYKKGAACSKCPSPSECDNGLCRLTAPLDQVKPHHSECERDFKSNCPMWANQMNQCESNPMFMHKECPKSCNICGPAPGSGGGSSNKPTTTARPTNSNSGDCKDKNGGCPGWKSFCNSHSYVKENCLKTCNRCGGSGGSGGGEACEDSDSRCPGWANRGECDANPGWMLSNCKKSCKQC